MKVLFGIASFYLIVFSDPTQAEKISDVANTKHNLSMDWGDNGTDSRTISAATETRICIFCHTPHASNSAAPAPLWNRKLAGDVAYTTTYSMYDSSSMESSKPSAPSNSSKLCLSCHDGVIAVGTVNVLNGVGSTINMNGVTAGGQIPSGSTRNIGTDLTNDHPISITYDNTLVTADGELNDPLNSPHVGVRGTGVRPLIPLIPDPLDGNKAKLECVSCHDPHIRDDSGTDIKFLRLNRFQTNLDPVGQGANPNLINFSENNDIICLACHNKEGWVDSAHANSTVANETYNNADAAERDFPLGIQVWQAACLNCHDTHTTAGSRRLLREGVVVDGTPAIEETCYQCHASNSDTDYVLNGTNIQVPNIKSDFQLARHMPITSAEQGTTTEAHDIGNTGISGDGKEMIEKQLTLGKGNLMNRHAECTDCHNPHRVTKNRLATDAPSNPAAAGTHDHDLLDGASQHNNLISGVLRGTWGVEPNYGASPFGTLPSSYTVKKGVPPQNGSTTVTAAYVTREYQVCLKCHSDYGFDDANPPALGYYSAGTPSGTNGVTHYTNQAMEFNSPNHHKGSPASSPDSGAHVGESSGYKYYEYHWNFLWGKWEWTKPLVLDTTTADCDSNGDPGCSCVTTCTSTNTITATANTGVSSPTTRATCGVNDVNTFASTGNPGFSSSPWDGTPWPGNTVVPAVPPYSAIKCSKTLDYTVNNHRSWHPVMEPTGRTATVRDLGGDTSAFLPPWDSGVGTQTMYCSDCHGSDTVAGTSSPSGGENGNPWGPHGSQNNFLLKGGWGSQTGPGQVNDLCFKCHDYDVYANPNAVNVSTKPSGFSSSLSGALCGGGYYGDVSINLHVAHARIYSVLSPGAFRCTACHTALPHGWKNKALLVNLSDVGPEAGEAKGTEIPDAQLPYNNGPYYLNAVNYIYNFKPSGQWLKNDCGDSNQAGVGGMMSACNNLP